jgi:hypothetical protein
MSEVKGDLRQLAERTVQIMRPFVDLRFTDALTEIVMMGLQEAYDRGLADGAETDVQGEVLPNEVVIELIVDHEEA